MSDFDSYAHDYRAALHRGLAVSGEDATFFAKGRVTRLSRCLKAHGFTPNTILDFGCGTGGATPFFFEILAAQSVVGVDRSAESLTIARTEHTTLAVEYKLTDEYQPRGTIDLAFSNGVFHHIHPTDRAAAVRYIAASLRPGGLFALWENNPWSPAARYVMRRIPFDQDAVMVWPGEARSLLASAGLTILGTDFHFLFPNCLSALRRLEPALRRLPLGAQYQVLARKRNAV